MTTGNETEEQRTDDLVVVRIYEVEGTGQASVGGST